MKKIVAIIIAVALCFTALTLPVAAKTTPAGETVGTVLFYITNAAGEQILVSQLPVTELEADMKAGKIDNTVHNYSLLDRFVTTLHQEAQGFTVPDFVKYAQSKSEAAGIRALDLSFAGKDQVRFWEIDQTGYDDMDSYTFDDLYGETRYNFPMLYKYWNYMTQDYYDPDGKMTREQVIDHIFKNGEEEIFLLSVRGFSQRYMITYEKYDARDYNMESYWFSQGLLDNDRTVRLMKPMTRGELYNKTPTASDTRYWTANILLDMVQRPELEPLGKVTPPTATMKESDSNYYVYFDCATEGATILYNHNYQSPSYSPTSPYGDGAVVIPKVYFPDGTVKLTARAVKEGYTDEGVITLTLKPSSRQEDAGQSDIYNDVKNTDWFYKAIEYVSAKKLIDPKSSTTFDVEAPMTRAALVTALYRLQGSPTVKDRSVFTDIPAGDPLEMAVVWAYQNGVVNGATPTTFEPNGSITREQIAAMMFRYAGKFGVDTTARGDLTVFTDSKSISDFAHDALSWANGKKLINGMGDGTVAPLGTATRAQVAQILLNFSAI